MTERKGNIVGLQRKEKFERENRQLEGEKNHDEQPGRRAYH